MIERCRECQGSVSTDAPTCPHCGAPNPAHDSTGSGYEWRSTATLAGVPWIHIAWGRDATGRRRVAKGVIAIGQFGIGAITIAQFGIGLLFGFGQFVAGLAAAGQFAAGFEIGLGQFASGEVAVGQFAIGVWVLAQIGFGSHVWSTGRKDPEAVAYFQDLAGRLGLW